MSASVHWIIAIAVGALLGMAGTFYFRNVVMRRDESSIGIAALAAMTWRDFIRLVLAALAVRGYSRVVNPAGPSGDDDYTLQRDGKHWLLSCKHGSAFVLGRAAISELGNNIRLGSAAGGILATQGRIADEARPVAALHRIELLDGPALWPELRTLMPAQQLAEIRASAAQRARQRVLLSWLLALAVGTVVGALLPAAPVAVDTPPMASKASPRAQSPAPAAPTTAAARMTSIDAPAPNDQAALAKQRKEAADTIATLPMVDRAVWSTASTLQIFLRDAEVDAAIRNICPLLVRYDALAPSRLQLTPPPDSQLPTRFRQCRSY